MDAQKYDFIKSPAPSGDASDDILDGRRGTDNIYGGSGFDVSKNTHIFDNVDTEKQTGANNWPTTPD